MQSLAFFPYRHRFLLWPHRRYAELLRSKAVRLTTQQRSDLVAQFEAGEGKKPLARAFGVDVRAVRAIIRRT